MDTTKKAQNIEPIASWQDLKNINDLNSSKSYKLVNNIICNETLSQSLVMFYGRRFGKYLFDFNGYSIINLKISTKNDYNTSLFLTTKGDVQFGNPCFVNPIIKSEISEDYNLEKCQKNQYSIRVSALINKSSLDTTIINPVVIGGGMKVVQGDKQINAINETVKNEFETPDIYMEDIYVDAVANSHSNESIFSSSINVIAGSATTKNLEIDNGWISFYPSDHPTERNQYIKFVNINITYNQYNQIHSYNGYYPLDNESGKSIKSGEVHLANIYVSGENSKLVNIVSGYGKTGNALHGEFLWSYYEDAKDEKIWNMAFDPGKSQSGNVTGNKYFIVGNLSKVKILQNDSSITGNLRMQRFDIYQNYWGVHNNSKNYWKSSKWTEGQEWPIKYKQFGNTISDKRGGIITESRGYAIKGSISSINVIH